MTPTTPRIKRTEGDHLGRSPETLLHVYSSDEKGSSPNPLLLLLLLHGLPPPNDIGRNANRRRRHTDTAGPWRTAPGSSLLLFSTPTSSLDRAGQIPSPIVQKAPRLPPPYQAPRAPRLQAFEAAPGIRPTPQWYTSPHTSKFVKREASADSACPGVNSDSRSSDNKLPSQPPLHRDGATHRLGVPLVWGAAREDSRPSGSGREQGAGPRPRPRTPPSRGTTSRRLEGERRGRGRRKN